MLTRKIVRSCRAVRKAVTPIVQGFAAHLEKVNLQANTAHPQKPVTDAFDFDHFRPAPETPALPVSATMRDILAERPEICEQIGWSAEQGTAALDGPPRRLLANHQAERAEHERLLMADKLSLQAGRRRLAALFPEPATSEPEPPAPRRRLDLPALSELLARRPRRRPH